MTNNTNNTNSGYCNSGNHNSGNCNSGDYNSGYCNSGNHNSGNCNSGDYNSGYCNSGYCNSGNHNSGDYNSGYCNSGYCNSGDYNSGYFNSNTPNIRLFNKDTNLTFDSDVIYELSNIIRSNIKVVCVWIEESKMNEEEKEQNPSYKTTGGYLKERDYKYCWQKGWEKMSEKEKDFIKDLPNFCPMIFEEITGISLKEKKESYS